MGEELVAELVLGSVWLAVAARLEWLTEAQRAEQEELSRAEAVFAVSAAFAASAAVVLLAQVD